MSNSKIKKDSFDPNLIPAETAARIEREQESYKQVKEEPQGDINTTGGFTVDQEGLANNYAIEPEMYVNEPGDLRHEQAANVERRIAEREAVNQTDEDGNLTMESDQRGKGVGII